MISLNLLRYSSSDPALHMALDEALWHDAEETERTEPLLRFYRLMSPAATIGFSQRDPALAAWLAEQGLPWVRRPTGGGVVFHRDDLIYTFVLPSAIHPAFLRPASTYLFIHELIQETLTVLGIQTTLYKNCADKQTPPGRTVCFERPVCGDLIWNAQKVAGAAERRSGRYLLHQGSLQIRYIISPGSRSDFFYDYFETTFLSTLEEKLGWKVKLVPLAKRVLVRAQALREEKYKMDGRNSTSMLHETSSV